jgi:outer membrane lipoprotein carrier protein
LDELSAKTKKYTSIKSDFVMEMESKDKKNKETQNGSLQLKGDKYKLDIKGQEIISDGKNTWTYLKDANEVQINKVDASNTEGVSPTTIFTIYEKGFKYKFESEKNGIQTISLFPNNPDKKKFHTIKLMVNKAKKEITAFTVLMKDGTTFNYTIKKFTPNTAITDAAFVFDAKTHPGVEVVDLRD